MSEVLMWWYERSAAFPRLSRMALDYLSIPGEYVLRTKCTHTDFIDKPHLWMSSTYSAKASLSCPMSEAACLPKALVLFFASTLGVDEALSRIRM